MVTQGTNFKTSFDFTSVSNGLSSNVSKSKDGISFFDTLSNTTKTSKDKTTIPQTNTDKDSIHYLGKEMDQSPVSKDNIKPKDSEPVATTSDNGTSSEAEKVSKLLDDVKEVVGEILGLSKEELESKMGILGLSMIDLLNPLSLQQLVLDSNGCEDAMSLLTNEELANTFSSLLDAVQVLVAESDMPLETIESVVKTDDFFNLLNQSVDEDTSLMNEGKIAIKNLKEEVNDETETTSDTSTEENKIAFLVERNEESDTLNESSDSSKKDLAKKNDATGVEQFLDNVTASVTKTETDFNGQLSTVTTVRDIANQIVEEIKVVINPSQTSMELQLNPEHLGKVNLTLTSKEGVMTAQFTTQTQAAKEAIESQMQVLKQNLENQGVKVEAIEVNVSNFSFNGSNEAGNKQEQGTNKGKKAFRMEVAKDIDVMEEVSPIQIGLADDTIPNIDYSA